jgi:hypothetical protein
MKNYTALLCMTVLALLNACATPTPPAHLIIPSDLSSHAEGVDSGYSTSNVAASWPRTRDFMVVSPAQLEKAQQKSSFTQHAPEQLSAEVLTMTTFRHASFHWINGALASDVTSTTTFAGSITPIRSAPHAPAFKSLSGILNNGEFAWEFVISHPEGGANEPAESGMVQDILGNQILIRALRQLENQPPSPRNLGFEYLQNGHPIGALSLFEERKVWLRSDLSPELKLMLSSLSSALLMRQSLQAR